MEPEERLEAYAFVEDYLGKQKKLPWKTAKRLSQEMEGKPFHMDSEALEALLLQRLETGQVRYSQYPGRKSLDLLWGHRKRVGDLEDLWDLRQDATKLRELVDGFEDFGQPADSKWIFLSHSFADVERIRALYRDLCELGYAVWVAETGILHGDSIVEKVQEGLAGSDRFAFYATRNSLSSRWTLKEADVAARSWKRPRTVIVDGDDKKLVKLFETWVESGWPDDFADRFRELIPDFPADAVSPTPLPTLLYSATKDLKERGQRRVVLYSERGVEKEPWSWSLATALEEEQEKP